ncbi:hypothetical protein [Sediminimonas qiaohouensis]|uniref:hypothetical protein n=1 Tax=Sediminimonas qiaohouensis TaxID=552061 RepID=UPI00047957AF|nr:hypothetical protein [Sediminimonas qiaohouensis]
MPNTSSPKACKAAKITPSSQATNADFEKFFGECGDDTRRKIFRYLGLPKRKKQPWGEFWNAVGLDPEQPEELWEDLTHGSDGKNGLWDAARVAEEIGLAASTVNGYCHKKSFPDDFPRPLIDASKKTRLWLPLEVRAYVRSSIYRARAEKIRRKPTRRTAAKKAERIPYTGTMQPLPPRSADAG